MCGNPNKYILYFETTDIFECNYLFANIWETELNEEGQT